MLNLKGSFRLDIRHLQTLEIAIIRSEPNAMEPWAKYWWVGAGLTLGLQPPDETWCSCKRDGALNGATCLLPPSSHAQWLNSCFSDSPPPLILLWALGVQFGPRGACGPTAAATLLLSVSSPYQEFYNLPSDFQGSVSCSELHFVYFGRGSGGPWYPGGRWVGI